MRKLGWRQGWEFWKLEFWKHNSPGKAHALYVNLSLFCKYALHIWEKWKSEFCLQSVESIRRILKTSREFQLNTVKIRDPLMISKCSDIWKLTLIKRNLKEVRSLYLQRIMIMIMQLLQTELGLSPSSVDYIALKALVSQYLPDKLLWI